VHEQAPGDPVAAAAALETYLDHSGARWQAAPELWADLMLGAAGAELDSALAGKSRSLPDGFDLLAQVLQTAPARDGQVSGILAEFVEGLPGADPCHATASLDWLFEREPSGDVLDQAGEQARELAPPVFLDCGEQLLDRNPQGALKAYGSLQDGFPDHKLASEARQGVETAETAIEAEHVQSLLNAGDYCTEPAPYRGAPAYSGAGPHRVLPVGPERFSDAIPSDWTAKDHTDAVLILCVEGPSDGSVRQTCQYEGTTGTLSGIFSVQLLANKYEVEAYELHSGELAFDTTVETGSGGCPPVLEWECSTILLNCPPPSSIRMKHKTPGNSSYN
jgi:hypothetical protein